jgi:hypothetical protein
MKPTYTYQQEEQMKMGKMLGGLATAMWKLDISDADTLSVPIAIEQEDGSWLLTQQTGWRRR